MSYEADIIKSLRSNDIDFITLLIMTLPELLYQRFDYESLFSYTIILGQLDMVKMVLGHILQQNQHLNLPFFQGWNSNRNLNQVICKDGSTALDVAIQNYRHDIVLLLLENGADPHYLSLVKICALPSKTSYFVKAVCMMNNPQLTMEQRQSMMNIIQALIQVGININAFCYDKGSRFSALDIAIANHHYELALLLLQKGALMGYGITKIKKGKDFKGFNQEMTTLLENYGLMKPCKQEEQNVIRPSKRTRQEQDVIRPSKRTRQEQDVIRPSKRTRSHELKECFSFDESILQDISLEDSMFQNISLNDIFDVN